MEYIIIIFIVHVAALRLVVQHKSLDLGSPHLI